MNFPLRFPVLLAMAFSMAAAKLPYPEEVNPGALRYPYGTDTSLYLDAPVETSATEPPKTHSPTPVPNKAPDEPPKPTAKSGRIFALPPSGKGFIRVLLQEVAKTLAVSSSSKARLHWLKRDGSEGDKNYPAGAIHIAYGREGFRITGAHGESFAGKVASLRLSPGDPDAVLGLNGKNYRGALDIAYDGAGLFCVNVLPMEEYLRGVVPLEMGRMGEGEMEALKAQAVVARTYGYKFMLAKGNAWFDVRASVQDQVYGGVSAEFGTTDRAIRETAGKVLVHHDTLAMCYYHSTCGGMTAARHEVWGGAMIPYLVTRADRDADGQPWCRASRYMHWSEEWTLPELASILRHNLNEAGVRNVPAFHHLKGLRIEKKFADGRVDVLEVRTDRGGFELHGDKIRMGLKTVSGRILRSAKFDIEVSGNRVVAEGGGYGHGVGMCQMGAMARSRAGQDCATILSAYYPGTVMETAE